MTELKNGRTQSMSEPYPYADFGSYLSRQVSEGYERFWAKNQLTTVWDNGEGRTVRTTMPRVRPKSKGELDFRNKKKGTKEDGKVY